LVRVTELVLIHLSRSVPRRLDGALYMIPSQHVSLTGCVPNEHVYFFVNGLIMQNAIE